MKKHKVFTNAEKLFLNDFLFENSSNFYCMLDFSLYKIADVVFKIGVNFEYTKKFLSAYKVEDLPYELEISFSVEEIERQAKLHEEQVFSIVSFENILIYGKLCEYILEHKNGLIFHSSALAFQGFGILFSANSGTGKSTHAGLWREVYGDRVKMINDDKPILRFIDGRFYIYGTPWTGKHKLGENIKVELKAICFIERANTCSIEKMSSASEILPRFLSQTVRNSDAVMIDRLFGFIDKIVEKINIYKLKVDISHQAVKVCSERILEDL